MRSQPDMPLPMPAPKAVLRILIIFCLVGWGAALIAQTSRTQPGAIRLEWLHDLIIFFFFSLVAFALFFVEYQLVQGLTKHDLNVTLGYVQSLGCFVLVLSGLWGIYYANGNGLATPSNPAFTENVLLAIYVFGHVVFVGNVVWSYMQEGNAR
jgi:hypothetical protein